MRGETFIQMCFFTKLPAIWDLQYVIFTEIKELTTQAKMNIINTGHDLIVKFHNKEIDWQSI